MFALNSASKRAASSTFSISRNDLSNRVMGPMLASLEDSRGCVLSTLGGAKVAKRVAAGAARAELGELARKAVASICGQEPGRVASRFGQSPARHEELIRTKGQTERYSLARRSIIGCGAEPPRGCPCLRQILPPLSGAITPP